MRSTTFRLAAVTGTAFFLAACASEPEPVVMQPQPAPMFTKDGMMIEQPQVMNQNDSDSDSDDTDM